MFPYTTKNGGQVSFSIYFAIILPKRCVVSAKLQAGREKLDRAGVECRCASILFSYITVVTGDAEISLGHFIAGIRNARSLRRYCHSSAGAETTVKFTRRRQRGSGVSTWESIKRSAAGRRTKGGGRRDGTTRRRETRSPEETTGVPTRLEDLADPKPRGRSVNARQTAGAPGAK